MHVKRYELSLKSWEAGAPKSLHTALEFKKSTISSESKTFFGLSKNWATTGRFIC